MSTPEDIYEDGKREDGENRMRARLEEMGRRGGPDAPDGCDFCRGTGRIYVVYSGDLVFLSQNDIPVHKSTSWKKALISTDDLPDDEGCPRCLGTGVQP